MWTRKQQELELLYLFLPKVRRRKIVVHWSFRLYALWSACSCSKLLVPCMHVGDAHDEVVVDRYDSWRCNARLLQVGEETTRVPPWRTDRSGIWARAFSPPPVLAGDDARAKLPPPRRVPVTLQRHCHGMRSGGQSYRLCNHLIK